MAVAGSTLAHAVEVVPRHRRPALGPAGVSQQLVRNRTALVGLIIIGSFVSLSLGANVVAPYDPLDVDFSARLQSPSLAHWFGTDDLGRDLLSRILFGSRLSLGVATVSALLIASIALAVGTTAAYWGGWLDEVLMRFVDVLLAFPSLVLTLALVGMLGAGLPSIMIGMVSVHWVGYSRIVRSLGLSIGSNQYVEAARALGASDLRILGHHFVPNIMPVIIVVSTLQMGGLILSVAALSFLGLGAKPPAPEWGAMINDGRNFLQNAPHMMIFPGFAIAMTVLGFNLLGDGLRDVLDPQLRSR